MIITDSFVMLNLPKTGSTFSRKAIKKAYENRYNSLSLLKKVLYRLNGNLKKFQVEDYWVKTINAHSLKSQHGGYIQIPKQHQNKKVISIFRDPFEAQMSRYEFQHWARFPLIPKDVLLREFPSFPDLNFNEYINHLKLTSETIIKPKYEIPSNVKIGSLSIQIILMFFKEPYSVLKNLSNKYLHSDAYLNDIADVTFLDNSDLNIELYNFLIEMGFKTSEVAFLPDFEKIHVTNRDSNSRNNLWSEETKAYMQDYETLLFKIDANLKNKSINNS